MKRSELRLFMYILISVLIWLFVKIYVNYIEKKKMRIRNERK